MTSAEARCDRRAECRDRKGRNRRSLSMVVSNRSIKSVILPTLAKGAGVFVSSKEAVAAARREQLARQCAKGRHVTGCPHRPAKG